MLQIRVAADMWITLGTYDTCRTDAQAIRHYHFFLQPRQSHLRSVATRASPCQTNLEHGYRTGAAWQASKSNGHTLEAAQSGPCLTLFLPRANDPAGDFFASGQLTHHAGSTLEVGSGSSGGHITEAADPPVTIASHILRTVADAALAPVPAPAPAPRPSRPQPARNEQTGRHGQRHRTYARTLALLQGSAHEL